MESRASRAEPVHHPSQRECRDWRATLADALTDPAELCRLLRLPRRMAIAARRAEGNFPLLVPRATLARIAPGDPQDPLLLQILPREEELARAPEFTDDPVGEACTGRTCGLLRQYQHRALMVATADCGVHCRFCFRRHFPYPNSPTARSRWQPAIDHIASDESIREVILSGGDPLTLDDHALAGLARTLARIPHVRRLRIHTRLPVVVPQRVTGEMLDWMRGGNVPSIVVIHVNHPREIDREVEAAIARLVDAGVPVLSQSVLLRAVNDRAEVLASLFERLVDLRVVPYYLHQLDRVAGAAHFEVPEALGARLIEALPGEPSKRALA
ncbi:MAG: EF-P beta-lysylation protein EpmB [Planctomycetota bacterium]|jgi:EF-P beta-lysylation protein EpmB